VEKHDQDHLRIIAALERGDAALAMRIARQSPLNVSPVNVIGALCEAAYDMDDRQQVDELRGRLIDRCLGYLVLVGGTLNYSDYMNCVLLINSLGLDPVLRS